MLPQMGFWLEAFKEGAYNCLELSLSLSSLLCVDDDRMVMVHWRESHTSVDQTTLDTLLGRRTPDNQAMDTGHTATEQ